MGSHSFFITMTRTRAAKERGTQPTVSIATRGNRLWSLLPYELIYAQSSRLRVATVRSTTLDLGQEKLNSGSSETTRIALEHALARLYLSE
jgi:hypothetical protein